MHLIDQQLNLMVRGRFEEAWKISEKLEELDPEDLRHKFNRAWHLIHQGDLQGGSKLLDAEKEFTFHAEFKDSNIESLINFYGELALSFVKNNYQGPFKEYDKSTTHLARFDQGFGMHEHFDSTKPNDIASAFAAG
jgi:hypothetical protein